MSTTRITCMFAAAVLCAASSALAQLTLANVSYTQNFNAMGSGATLPNSWRMSAAGVGSTAGYATTGFFSTTSQSSNSGTPATGGRYNWGNGATTSDRAVGFMTSSTFASPNSVWFAFTNDTGSTVTGLDLSFDYERYRINTAAASVSFATSGNGSTWTAVSAGDSGAFSTGASSYTFTGGTTVNRTPSLTGLNIANGESYYFRWLFNTTGSNSQGIGLDNFSLDMTLQAVPEPLAAAGVMLLSSRVLGRRSRLSL